MSKSLVPLIMCGGAGTRLWSASREVRPKQLLPLFGARSTFQDPLLRVSDEALFERPIVVTNAAYCVMVLGQLAEIGLEADNAGEEALAAILILHVHSWTSSVFATSKRHERPETLRYLILMFWRNSRRPRVRASCTYETKTLRCKM